MQVKFRKKSQITLPMAVVEQLELKVQLINVNKKLKKY